MIFLVAWLSDCYNKLDCKDYEFHERYAIKKRISWYISNWSGTQSWPKWSKNQLHYEDQDRLRSSGHWYYALGWTWSHNYSNTGSVSNEDPEKVREREKHRAANYDPDNSPLQQQKKERLNVALENKLRSRVNWFDNLPDEKRAQLYTRLQNKVQTMIEGTDNKFKLQKLFMLKEILQERMRQNQ